MEYDLVFEGGGAKGMAFIGALQELEARGYAPARLLGASAGAIMATFLAAGYSSEEMAAALNEKQDGQPVFLGFLETPPKLTEAQIQNSAIREALRSYNSKLIPDFLEEQIDDQIAGLMANSLAMGRICSFIELGGFFAAQNFLVWLENKLNSGLYCLERGKHGAGNPRAFGKMNLAQFSEATGIDLSLVASDTTAEHILVLNHHTAPDCPLVWAVRMSMSFPLLWQEVVWQADWGKYMGKDISGHTIVDGGLLSNFPIELFLSNRDHILNLMGERTTQKEAVIGFLIDEALEVAGAGSAATKPGGFSVGQFIAIRRVSNLINTMTQAHDKLVIEAYEKYVVHLPAKGYGTIEFGMSDPRRDALIAAGRKAVRDYLDQLETPFPGTLGPGEPEAQAPSLEPADRIATKILSP